LIADAKVPLRHYGFGCKHGWEPFQLARPPLQAGLDREYSLSFTRS